MSKGLLKLDASAPGRKIYGVEAHTPSLLVVCDWVINGAWKLVYTDYTQTEGVCERWDHSKRGMSYHYLGHVPDWITSEDYNEVLDEVRKLL